MPTCVERPLIWIELLTPPLLYQQLQYPAKPKEYSTTDVLPFRLPPTRCASPALPPLAARLPPP